MSTALSADQSSQGAVIIGGGITGLYSALLALDSGQKDIHVYEATDRLGGKIKSTTLNGQVLNMGAEFVDADHERILKIVKRLQADPEFLAKYPEFADALKLNECTEQKTTLFQGPGGKVMQDFLPRYAPIAHQVMRDRELMETNPAYAQQLKNESLTSYLSRLGQSIPANENRGILGRIWDAVTFKSNHVDAAVIATAAQAYTSEVGQPPENITAAQFIAETSPSAAKFLGSDCGYRVAGGTHAMIEALHHYLEMHGVQFHFGEKLESVTKGGDGVVNLTMNSARGTHQLQTRHAMIGLPSYALAEVKGLETFGLPPQAQQMLADVQYTNSVKFTIPLKPGVQLPQLNLFSPGVQSWSPVPGFLTFLCINHDGLKPAQLVQESMQKYVAAYGNGKMLEDLFDLGPGKIAFANPGKAACYSTPSPKNAAASEQLFKQMESLADQGLGIAGTYMPLDGSVGFMECGAASAERAHARMMVAQERGREAAQSVQPKFQEIIAAQRAAAANGNQPAMGVA